MEKLNEKLLNAFQKMNKLEAESLLKQGADKQVVIDYVKNTNGWNLSMSQDWMLRELFYK